MFIELILYKDEDLSARIDYSNSPSLYIFA